MRILAVDAGNSRIKWGLREHQQWLMLGVANHTEIDSLAENWKTLPAPHKIIVSNVAGEKSHAHLKKLFSIWPAHCEWVRAKPTECGVSNGYDDPAQLGADRWAALIAAWDLRHTACLVVNAGTAMTVDGLNDKGEFLGGVIIPGLQAMRQALAQSTAAISLRQVAQDKMSVASAEGFKAFPINSADAAHNGCLQALVGAVERMWEQLQRDSADNPYCILSGGDALALQPLLSMPVQVMEHLVLDGLIKIAQQEEAS